MKQIQSIFILLTLLVSFYACTKTESQSAALTQTSITKVFPTNLVTNQKIYIEGQNFDSITSVVLPGNIAVTNFERQGFNQISLTAPAGMTNGFVILMAGSKQYISPNQINVVVPTFTKSFPDSVKATEVITILGTNLIEMKQVILGDTTIVDALQFKRKSDTEIQVTVPTRSKTGSISLKMVSLSGLIINLPNVYVKPAGLAPLAYAFYEDALMNNWQNWGWGVTIDFANTEKVRDGAKAMKVQYTGQWSALKFANGSVSTVAYTELAFSIFGTAGTDGKVIHVLPSGGLNVPITIQEGKWVEFKLPLSTLGSPATITDCMFQNEAWTGTVYFDHIGLR